MSDERERELLRERAERLARVREHAQANERGRLAAFRRGDTRYAVELAQVRCAAHVLSPTRLPNSEPYWLGVTSLHGELLPIFDLPALLGARNGQSEPETEARARLLVLVLGRETSELALLIDGIEDALPLSEPLSTVRAELLGAEGLLRGTTRDGTHVLDAEALLADPRLTLEASRTGGA